MTPLLLGLATVLVPLVAGVFAGRGLRRALPATASLPGRLISAAIVVVLAILFGNHIPISIYDLLLIAVCFGAGLLASEPLRTRPASFWMSATAALVSTTLSLGLAELVARRVLPGFPEGYRPPDIHFVFDDVDMDFVCRAMFPPGALPFPTLPRIPGKRRTVYVGDSMLAGLDVAPNERVTSIIQAASPEAEHIAWASIGIGPDVYLDLTKKAISSLAPDHLVVFLFLGNDLTDIDQPHFCCGSEPIVDYGSAPPSVQCHTLKLPAPLRQKLKMGPAPYLLRAFARWSLLAYRTTSAFDRWSHQERDLRTGLPTPQQVEHTMLVLGTLGEEVARQGRDFTLVVLPARWSLEAPVPHDPLVPLRSRLVEEMRGRGIHVVDTWDVLQAAIDRDPRGDYFLRDKQNFHLGVAGHRLLAQRLLDEVVAKRNQ